MSSGLNWDRAKRDSAAARRRAERLAERPLRTDHEKPVSSRQLKYLASLAGKLDRPVPDVSTAYQASLAIGQLKRLLDAQAK